MELLIKLLDGDGKTVAGFKLPFDSQTTIETLRNNILRVFLLPKYYQQFFCNNFELNLCFSSDLLVEKGVKDRDTLFVKHSKLSHWAAYKYSVSAIGQFNDEEKIKLAENALKLYNILLSADFFLCYPRYSWDGILTSFKIGKIVKKSFAHIEQATRVYFRKHYEKDVTFPEDENIYVGGTRAAVICSFEVGGQIQRYRIKTNHDAGVNSRASSFPPNLIELYIYKLLEEIGVGVEIIFVSNSFFANSIIYIGSKMIDDFILFEKCSDYDREKVKQVLVQLNFLAAFLSIGDLHITNFGIKKNGKLIVFDFMCSNVPDAQKSFLDDCLISFNGEANIHIDEFFKLCRELLKQCETTERIRIAKLAIGEWELLDKIDVARKIMSDQKLFLNEEQQINYDKGTKELDDYVSKIRANIQKFMEKGMQT